MTTQPDSAVQPQSAEMWFDPSCPWAYLTSRWLMEVEKVRDVEITWSVMSLAVLNDGRDLDPEYMANIPRWWMPVRAVAAAAEVGQEHVKPMYDAIGRRIHLEKRGKEMDDMVKVIQEAVAECGLPESVAEAAQAEAHDDKVRASHQRAMDLVGNDVGTPVIKVGEAAFFGPVISPIPTGEAAGRLWDGCYLVGSTPGFSELKRARTGGLNFDGVTA